VGRAVRRFWIAGAICLALSSVPAHAGDMAKRAVAPAPAVAAAPSWSGLYFGPTLGWNFASAQGDYTGAPPPPPPVTPMVYYPFDISPSGGSVGGQAGINWQFGSWVFGLEGDWSWVFSASDRGFDPAGSGRYDDVTLLWTGHARGRIGYLYNQFLIFFSGGAAFAGTEAKHFVPAGNTLYFDTRTLVGYSLGGGVETFFFNNWIFRVEYLHDRFGNQHYDWVAGSRYSNSDLTIDTVRVSFIWRP